MTGDGGLGQVILKNQRLSSEHTTDCLQAVKNGNGKDWWILFRTPSYPDSIFIYTITKFGVQLHHIDNVGPSSTSDAGDLRFNSNGTQFAYCNWKGVLALYDYDSFSFSVTIVTI